MGKNPVNVWITNRIAVIISSNGGYFCFKSPCKSDLFGGMGHIGDFLFPYVNRQTKCTGSWGSQWQAAEGQVRERVTSDLLCGISKKPTIPIDMIGIVEYDKPMSSFTAYRER